MTHARALLFNTSAALAAWVPGLLYTLAVVITAVTLTDVINGVLGRSGLVSYIMVAIVIGFAARNMIGMPQLCAPGLRFCLTWLLRFGIILMGFRLSVVDAGRIGAWGLPIIAICIVTGLAVSALLSRLLNLPQRLGTLIAVGTSICGATAIVAAAPAIDADENEVAYAVANITVFGIAAMFAYPYVAHWLFADNVVMAGLFQGTAIHETAQVTGAALIYDATFGTGVKPGAADIAIVTKLVRNVAIAAVVPWMAFLHVRRVRGQAGNGNRRVSALKLFPLFILGFIAMAALRSLGDAALEQGEPALGLWNVHAWQRGAHIVNDVAVYALAMAMAGVGLGTRLSNFKGLGLKPFYAGFAAALAVGCVSIASVYALGHFVTL